MDALQSNLSDMGRRENLRLRLFHRSHEQPDSDNNRRRNGNRFLHFGLQKFCGVLQPDCNHRQPAEDRLRFQFLAFAAARQKP